MTTDRPDLDPEDAKIITLARGAMGRIGATRGVAVRDETGRTYAAADVDIPGLTASAVVVAVATAASSGARGLEAVAVVGRARMSDDDRAAISALGGCPVLLCEPDGTPVGREVVASRGSGAESTP